MPHESIETYGSFKTRRAQYRIERIINRKAYNVEQLV